ncbi:MAG: permease family-domain-containing protein [Monoraphidium minutum]|nr:MAG: permease family-domain-containing protein [Monoraphidium minutum]
MASSSALSRGLDRFFHITERGSSVSTEIKAGLVTFLTMSYILLVNPQILAVAGLPVKEVVTATALSSMVASLLVGVGCNMPFGMSPGMGLNAYLVYSQVLGADVSVEAALTGCLVAAGVVAALAVVRALALILGVVPDSIKLATVVGMGLLLTFIGLQSAGIVVADPETMVTVGDLLALRPALAIAGLALITSLTYRNVRGGIMIGILATAVAYFAAAGGWPTHYVDVPRLRIGRFDWTALFVKPAPGAWNAVTAYSLVMIFDIGGVMFGLGNLAGIVKDGTIPGATTCYLAACAGTALGALTGTTPLIIAAENAVGIKEGGRTGLMAVTIAACFGMSVFFAPFLQSIPQVATAPVLVLVGAMMMGESHQIEWHNMLTAVPAFLTIVIQPFTFSIANGIYAGLLMSALVYLLTGAFVDVGRGWIARLRGGGAGGPGPEGGAGPMDVMDVAEAAYAGTGAKHDGGDGLDAPLLGAAAGAAASASDAASLPGSLALSAHDGGAAPPTSDAISIGQRRSSGGQRDGTSGSLSRSHPYERGSFSMYTNTAGSHPAASHLAGFHTGTPPHEGSLTGPMLPRDDHA